MNMDQISPFTEESPAIVKRRVDVATKSGSSGTPFGKVLATFQNAKVSVTEVCALSESDNMRNRKGR